VTDNLSEVASEEMKQLFIEAYTETGNSVLKHLETDLKNGTITVAKNT